MPSDPEEETREAPPDPDKETQGVLSDPEEKTREAPLDLEETHGSPSDPEETKDVAWLVTGSTDLEDPVVLALWMLTISGNIPSNNVIAHIESTGARRRGRSSAETFSADD